MRDDETYLRGLCAECEEEIQGILILESLSKQRINQLLKEGLISESKKEMDFLEILAERKTNANLSLELNKQKLKEF